MFGPSLRRVLVQHGEEGMAECVAVGVVSHICSHHDRPESQTNRPESGTRLSPKTTSTSQAASPNGPLSLGNRTSNWRIHAQNMCLWEKFHIQTIMVTRSCLKLKPYDFILISKKKNYQEAPRPIWAQIAQKPVMFFKSQQFPDSPGHREAYTSHRLHLLPRETKMPLPASLRVSAVTKLKIILWPWASGPDG